jgi:hypothetical protein
MPAKPESVDMATIVSLVSPLIRFGFKAGRRSGPEFIFTPLFLHKL